jgi:hypothetical protein
MINSYRVYATILGYTLPKNKGLIEFTPGIWQRISKCNFLKMSFREQKRRGFKPIKTSSPNTSYYKNFQTYPFGTDIKILRSSYVIYTDVEIYSINGAVGAAMQIFDKVVGTLTLGAMVLFSNKYKREILHQNYDYQIVKVYKVENNKELEINDEELSTISGMVSMPGWPQRNVNFSEINEKLLKNILEAKDEVFCKAFGYYTEANKNFNNYKPIFVAYLNWVKCIELIINRFKGKYFKKRLKNSAKNLHLSAKEVESIELAWKIRNDGDFAHAKKISNKKNYPPQFPIPEEHEFIPGQINGVAGGVLLKYFDFSNNCIEIFVEVDHKHGECEYLDELVNVNLGQYYQFHTHEKDKIKLNLKIKEKISIEFKIKKNKIKILNDKNTLLRDLPKDRLITKIEKDKDILNGY